MKAQYVTPTIPGETAFLARTWDVFSECITKCLDVMHACCQLHAFTVCACLHAFACVCTPACTHREFAQPDAFVCACMCVCVEIIKALNLWR